MNTKIDIHQYERLFNGAMRHMDKSEISDKNKRLISEFVDHLTALELSKPRIIKYIQNLTKIAQLLKADYDKVGIPELKKVVCIIQGNQDYSPWTIHCYKIIIKRFYKWLKGNDETYPLEVSWIKTTFNKKKRKLPGDGDLLNEKDVEKLITSADHPRDKALVSVLYESGSRIGEVGSLLIKNVKFDEYGVTILVDGKTGPRPVRLVSSTPYLVKWLESHPHRDNPMSSLWTYIGKYNYGEPMRYQQFRKLLVNIFRTAGINKRRNPHLFRHSRATYLADHLTEFQMNQYFGWVQGSNMPSTYVHLNGKQINNSILKLNGIETTDDNNESMLKPKVCNKCNTLNSHLSQFCSKCGGIFDVKTAVQIQEKQQQEQATRQDSDSIMNILLKDNDIKELLLKKMFELGINRDGAPLSIP